VFVTFVFIEWFSAARTLTAVGDDVRHLADDRVRFPLSARLDQTPFATSKGANAP